ncbi:MAG: hypothetical protein GY754_01505 [bacterium]|nr:hypothetical protein [bacterium]
MKKLFYAGVIMVLALAFSGCEAGLTSNNDSAGDEQGSGFSFSNLYAKMNAFEEQLKQLKITNTELEETINELGGKSSDSISNLETAVNTLIAQKPPIGTILAWHKNKVGGLAIPEGWVECDARITINDPASPFDGQNPPDLNGRKLFLRGGYSSSEAFEGDQFKSHSHGGKTGTGVDVSGHNSGRDYNSLNDHLGSPPYSAHYVYAYDHYNVGSYLQDHKHTISSEGGDETRPKNMTVVWIMRIK